MLKTKHSHIDEKKELAVVAIEIFEPLSLWASLENKYMNNTKKIWKQKNNWFVSRSVNKLDIK